MPKRRKQKPEEEREGRPPDLTLASFLCFPTVSTSCEGTSSSHPGSSSHEPLLDGAELHTVEPASTQQLAREDSIPAFSVHKSKKGKLPITYENRAKGKKVTVVSNVCGQADLLLSELKRRSGAGGAVRGETIELQGDHQVFLTKFLSDHPCVMQWKPKT